MKQYKLQCSGGISPPEWGVFICYAGLDEVKVKGGVGGQGEGCWGRFLGSPGLWP